MQCEKKQPQPPENSRNTVTAGTHLLCAFCAFLRSIQNAIRTSNQLEDFCEKLTPGTTDIPPVWIFFPHESDRNQPWGKIFQHTAFSHNPLALRDFQKFGLRHHLVSDRPNPESPFLKATE
jgi:hypothetical protein